MNKTTAAIFCLTLAFAPTAAPAQQTALIRGVHAVMQRPAFRHSTFAVLYYDLDAKRAIYGLNADKFMAPASTTKLVTEGTLLSLLGPDFRFHTRVYATAPIGADSTLNGDLVLVASGDPNLSQRVQPDGTLAFENEDHVYNGDAVPGDPLAVIRSIAATVAKRVKVLNGRVLIDATLFPEGERESGTGTVVSPIVINDNAVDVTVSPGSAIDAPATLNVSPDTRYVKFVNRVTTSRASTPQSISFSSDVAAADGTRTVTVSGTIPVGAKPSLNAYAIPVPSLFGEIVLTDALAAAGVTIHSPAQGGTAPDFSALRASYTDANLVAEHVSPPLSEEAKVTLKVSQNLHAHLAPYLIGVYKMRSADNPAQAGFDAERQFLTGARIDPQSASIADGEGTAYLTPEFVVSFLRYIRTTPIFAVFYRALPVLGVDGTLWNIQNRTPAAGKVHAKTGTDEQPDLLNRGVMVYSKGLAGYVRSRHGRNIAFAVYLDGTNVKNENDVTSIGQAVGELAALAYEL